MNGGKQLYARLLKSGIVFLSIPLKSDTEPGDGPEWRSVEVDKKINETPNLFQKLQCSCSPE
jgi:hypothetical protein